MNLMTDFLNHFNKQIEEQSKFCRCGRPRKEGEILCPECQKNTQGGDKDELGKAV